MHRKKSGTVSQNTQATAKRLIFEFSDDTPYRFFFFLARRHKYLSGYVQVSSKASLFGRHFEVTLQFFELY